MERGKCTTMGRYSLNQKSIGGSFVSSFPPPSIQLFTIFNSRKVRIQNKKEVRLETKQQKIEADGNEWCTTTIHTMEDLPQGESAW